MAQLFKNNSPIVLFTSAENLPIIITTPTHSSKINVQPIFLALFGPGHYDVAIFNDQSTCTPSTREFCLCGSNKTIKGIPCTLSKSYSARCPCYNNQCPCSNDCICKGCQNNFGSKPIISKDIVVPPTERRKHKSQKQEI